MIYTKKELLQKGETDYSIRCKVQTKHLFVIEHGVYSDKPKAFVDEIYICKKYPNAILTGLSAFYIYDLTDHIPDKFYLVTVQHSFPIRRKEVHQSYQESNCFSIGLSQMKYANNEMLEKRIAEGMSLGDARNVVAEEILLKKIASSELAEHVALKGGIVMYNLTKNERRVTKDLDFDLIRYSIDFVNKL